MQIVSCQSDESSWQSEQHNKNHLMRAMFSSLNSNSIEVNEKRKNASYYSILQSFSSFFTCIFFSFSAFSCHFIFRSIFICSLHIFCHFFSVFEYKSIIIILLALCRPPKPGAAPKCNTTTKWNLYNRKKI